MEYPVTFEIELKGMDRRVLDTMYLDTTLPFVPTKDMEFGRRAADKIFKVKWMRWSFPENRFFVGLEGLGITETGLEYWREVLGVEGFMPSSTYWEERPKETDKGESE